MNCKNQVCIQTILPETAKYFKEELLEDILTIPPTKPDIDKVIDVLVSAEVVDIKTIDTEVGKSNEGQNLSGVKLIAEIKIKEKVIYSTCSSINGVHSAHFETYNSMFVILPEKIGNRYACESVMLGRASVVPYIEGHFARKLDCRNVYKCIMILLDVIVC